MLSQEKISEVYLTIVQDGWQLLQINYHYMYMKTNYNRM